MYQGWIKLHRQLQQHWIWDDKPFSKGQAWIDMLMSANHSDNKFLLGSELVEVKSGSFITSIRQLGEKWGWSVGKVKRFLGLLESDNMVMYKCDAKKTVVTIVKYSDYQFTGSAMRDTNETPTEQVYDTNETKTETNNNVKNVKKEKNVKKIIADLPPELQQPVLDFMDMRKSIKKPMTDKALELMISKLNKMSNEDTNTAIDILNQSIMNSWQGIFPLKAEQIAESKTEKELNAAYTMISDWVGDENV